LERNLIIERVLAGMRRAKLEGISLDWLATRLRYREVAHGRFAMDELVRDGLPPPIWSIERLFRKTPQGSIG
jgi:DNA invertase Pin-like site-specific DNA recombinase